MLIFVALLLPMSVIAQRDATIDSAMKLTKGGNYLDANYKVTKPLFALVANGNNVSADETKHKVTFEIINFGTEGNTVLLTLDLEKEGSQTYSWSGKNLHVLPGYDGGTGSLAVLRGSTICGALGVAQGKWLAMVNTGSNTYTISDFKKGMTRAEVEGVVSQLGLSQFKFSRKSGNLNVYSLLWLTEEKRWDFYGRDYKYQLRNDKKYGDFYFDAQGKLVKWLLFM